MKLIYKAAHGKHIKSGDLVKVGDKVLTRGGDVVTVDYFTTPHKPSSSGKVSVRNQDGNVREFYVGVIDAEWIEREDRDGFETDSVHGKLANQ